MVERHERSTAPGVSAGGEAMEEAEVPRATETDWGKTGATPEAVRDTVGRRGHDEAEDETRTEDERH